MVASSNYRDGQTGGRGYIGLVAMIFGNWRPGGLLAGAGLFGLTQPLGLRPGGGSGRARPLAGAVLALAAAFFQFRRGRGRTSAAVMAGIGILLGVTYFL